MKSILFIFSFISLTYCSEIKQEYYSNGHVELEETYENGKLASEVMFKNGVAQGSTKRYED